MTPDSAALHPGDMPVAARPASSKVSTITIIYSPKPAEKPPVARPTTTKSTRSIDLASLLPAD